MISAKHYKPGKKQDNGELSGDRKDKVNPIKRFEVNAVLICKKVSFSVQRGKIKDFAKVLFASLRPVFQSLVMGKCDHNIVFKLEESCQSVELL